MKKKLRNFLKQRRGMVGLEAAIVLIAFVIVAAAFSFMVVNMGLFATQRGRETIQQGVSEAGSPLTLDGSIYIYSNGTHALGVVIPLKTLGVRYVPMKSPETEITMSIENHTAIADIYNGINSTDPSGLSLTVMYDGVQATNATLFIGNSDSDSSLDYNEKGFLLIKLNANEGAAEREHVYVEIRPERGAPLTIDFIVPPQLTQGWHTIGS
jgi:flagellin FlaB